jgi:hypothetical protein
MEWAQVLLALAASHLQENGSAEGNWASPGFSTDFLPPVLESASAMALWSGGKAEAALITWRPG